MRANIPAIVLIVIGTILLLNNLHLWNVSITHLIQTWWPAILIVLGLSMMFKRGK